MKRFKRLMLTVAALAALAVGGAAFAQAQNAGSVAKTQVETRSVETNSPADPADGPTADRNEADGSEAGEQEESGSEAGADRPDAAGENESPHGPTDQDPIDGSGRDD
ncbi:MAG TPA: hypothetical protein VFL77_05420 [Solirubrobacterales bacterium]|nr:hypothetical protein [Solirubrobacterales bacterium]